MFPASSVVRSTLFETPDGLPYPLVRKRDGTLTPFSLERIAQAVYKTGCAAGVDDFAYAGQVTALFLAKFLRQTKTSVTEIQSLVEHELMSGPHKEIARAGLVQQLAHARFGFSNANNHVVAILLLH